MKNNNAGSHWVTKTTVQSITGLLRNKSAAINRVTENSTEGIHLITENIVRAIPGHCK
jgi:hypothetical protein